MKRNSLIEHVTSVIVGENHVRTLNVSIIERENAIIDFLRLFLGLL